MKIYGWKPLLESYGRVFLAASLAAYLGLDHGLQDLTAADLWSLANAGLGAALVTAINVIRPGETAFGVTSKTEESSL